LGFTLGWEGCLYSLRRPLLSPTHMSCLELDAQHELTSVPSIPSDNIPREVGLTGQVTEFHSTSRILGMWEI